MSAKLKSKEFAAFVVLGFQDITGDLSSMKTQDLLKFFPKNKKELLQKLDSLGVDKVPYETHKNLPWTTWETVNGSDLYELSSSEKAGQEPYYVMKKEYRVLYDEVFVGCGFDKLSQLYELSVAQYRMYLLSEGFLIHLDSNKLSYSYRRKHWCARPVNDITHLKENIFYEKIEWMYGEINEEHRTHKETWEQLQASCTPIVQKIQ